MKKPPAPSGDQKRPAVGVGTVVLKQTPQGLEVLLIRRGRAPWAGEWSIPGGRQEWGESVRETAIREVREETAVEITNLSLLDVVDGITHGADGHVDKHWTLVDFRADWVSGDLRPGDDAADAKWVSVTDLDHYRLWGETRRIIAAALAVG